MDLALGQRSRAALEFLGAAQGYAGGTLQRAAERAYDRAVPDPPADLDGRRASVSGALAGCGPWHLDRLVTRWVAEEVYVRALPAVEEVRGAAEAALQVPADAPGALELHPETEPPAYWSHGFHLTPGGWDGHDLMGTAIHEIVYDYVLTPGGVGAVRTGQDLNDHRTLVARQAPRDAYRSIVELGSGTGRYTLRLQQVYPDAEVTAVELSTSSLRHARARAAADAVPVRWVQADAGATGLPGGRHDLVTAYTLLHEMPAAAAAGVLAEAFRLLAPGGDLLIGEVAPYSEQTAFRAVVLDWETENRGEPYWREALSTDLPALLRATGFTDVEARGVDGVYPWVTLARKPAAAAA